MIENQKPPADYRILYKMIGAILVISLVIPAAIKLLGKDEEPRLNDKTYAQYFHEVQSTGKLPAGLGDPKTEAYAQELVHSRVCIPESAQTSSVSPCPDSKPATLVQCLNWERYRLTYRFCQAGDRELVEKSAQTVTLEQLQVLHQRIDQRAL
ncbi:MAG: hypothetical protein EOP09_15245 [Proteobacteria bacterium]|nr:MAG: hypothetical protein EOP09_15245 [Pseudomonadota bacterium]